MMPAQHVRMQQLEGELAEAKAEIKRLVARVGELEAALRPFAVWSKHTRGTGNQYMLVDVACIHAAAQALANGEQER